MICIDNLKGDRIMKKIIKAIFFGSVVLGAAAMSGCSTHAKLDQVATQVDIVNHKVDHLQGQVRDLHAQAGQAMADASRANARLDNQEQIKDYKK